MAIAVDSSTPASFKLSSSDSASSVTTNSFNPPANSLILVAVGCNSASGSTRTVTISNNSTALTWQQIGIRNAADSGGLDGFAGLWCAPLLTARTGMTVTATPNNSTSSTCAIEPYVLTGVDLTTPVGSVAEGSFTASTTAGTLVSQKASSLGIIVVNQWSYSTGIPTSSSTTNKTYDAGSHICGFAGYKTLGAAGSNGTFSLSGGGTCDWVAAEIRPAGNPAQFMPFFL
ncbi:MAG: hypothetical protein J2P17_27450 [Mycobacterium sp.]|nr:hypothetical protein [Mycobacterium sp.]